MADARINAARLDTRVSIQTKTETPDAQGRLPSPSWATDETVWAEVRAMSGMELVEAHQLDDRITHKVTMRYTANLTAQKRLLLEDGTTMNVSNAPIRVDRRGDVVECMAIQA